MRFFEIPGIEKPLSSLVLGTMTFGDTVSIDGAQALLETAVAAGTTAIDTANGYAGGASEEMLSVLLNGKRDQFLLATKAGMPHSDAQGHAPLSEKGLRLSLEGSLRRLGTENVDLFYLHQPDRATSLDETMATVAELANEGKIGALGVSNFSAWQISELNAAAERNGAPKPVIAQQLYNLVARRIEEEYTEFACQSGLHTMVYNPLGGGLLTGRYSYDTLPSGGRFDTSRLASMYKERYWDKDLFEAINALNALAQSAGISAVELSFRWLLSKPVANSILLGGSRSEQLEANLAILAKGPLEDSLIEACDEVGAVLRGPMPNYNR